jgi:hypothetical protein
MTMRGGASHAAANRSLQLALQSGRRGDWTLAATWLAERLNEVDAKITSKLDSAGRRSRQDDIDRYINQVDGDRRDLDVIVLADGTRVCWHLGHSRATTSWTVETRERACA